MNICSYNWSNVNVLSICPQMVPSAYSILHTVKRAMWDALLILHTVAYSQVTIVTFYHYTIIIVVHTDTDLGSCVTTKVSGFEEKVLRW